ncbi:MAG: peptide deformylase [Bacteroidales bacterium]|nr:peptide deformylase [Bacteroidales bacterium]
MKLPIYLYGHPVLRAVSKDLTPEYPDLQKLIDDMFETMYFSEGVGLAAPQVGKNIRLIVIDATPVAENFPDCDGWKKALINPKLEVLDGDMVSRSEGCLSLPGMSEDVKRVEHIRLTWLDENFEEHCEEFTGFLSRIIQHECDHLEGKVYMDRVSAIRRQLDRSKLNNIATGKVHCDYPTRTAPPKRKR